MTKVTLCGSVKYRDKIEEAFLKFKEVGFSPLFPDGKTIPKELPEMEYKRAIALEHYKAMRKADIIYFVLPNGYMGTSVKLELGFAVALNKPIYFSEKTGDAALDHYPKAFVAIKDIGAKIHE